ncbi:MAG TPA: VOC family protein [Thermoleophilaceae bacterium]|nr:VOC family protein [Thermoleophilaceae bacterium]
MRPLLRAVAALLALAGAVFAGAQASAPVTRPAQAAPLANAVVSVGYTVSDLDRAARFFTEVLDFTRVPGEREIAGEAWERLAGVFGLRARVASLRLGDEELELTEYLAPRSRPIPAEMRGNDRAFQHVAIVVSDMARAYRKLRENHVAHASSGPQRLPDWNPNAGGIEAFYFRDPDGHFLELIAFPAGKGDPKWKRAAESGRLFLGLDHTAIVVADTETSLRLYRDALGLRVAGESENWGTEQEHLNNVFGARLRITGLRAAAGPGIELLEYLAPRDGRPAPADLRASDLLHWQTTLATADAAAAAQQLRPPAANWVSPGEVALPADEAGFRRGLTLRDPDGHALRLTER